MDLEKLPDGSPALTLVGREIGFLRVLILDIIQDTTKSTLYDRCMRLGGLARSSTEAVGETALQPTLLMKGEDAKFALKLIYNYVEHIQGTPEDLYIKNLTIQALSTELYVQAKNWQDANPTV